MDWRLWGGELGEVYAFGGDVLVKDGEVVAVVENVFHPFYSDDDWLYIIWFEPDVFGDACQHAWANFFLVVKGKNIILPSGAR
ncbi:MAG: hypothetical protein MUO64_12480 [Anaerolineales bacterium]|nr:hypothetical protein [Anaerolineales bacterium]